MICATIVIREVTGVRNAKRETGQIVVTTVNKQVIFKETAKTSVDLLHSNQDKNLTD